MQLATRLNEVGLNQRFKFDSICENSNATYLICPIQQLGVVLTCIEMVQIERLDFSDHFSYINLFNLSYRLLSMVFRSFN